MDKFLTTRKRLYTTSRGGYITLISVLIVGAVGVSVTVSLVLLGLGASRTSFATEQSVQARALADACTEEVLQTVHDTVVCLPGETTDTFGHGSCTATVTLNGLTCTIRATGTVGNSVRRTEAILSAIDPIILMSSWREVADF